MFQRLFLTGNVLWLIGFALLSSACFTHDILPASCLLSSGMLALGLGLGLALRPENGGLGLGLGGPGLGLDS